MGQPSEEFYEEFDPSPVVEEDYSEPQIVEMQNDPEPFSEPQETEIVMDPVREDPVRDDPVREDPVRDDPIVEEVFIEEEIVIEEELIVEEAELLQEEVLVAEENSPTRKATVNVNAVAIAMNQVREANRLVKNEVNNAQSRSLSSSNSSSVQQGGLSNQGTFETETTAFEDATFTAVTDPSVAFNFTQSEETEQVVEIQNDSSTMQMDQGFQEQQNQSFSTGQSITAVLNNVTPNFSQFDVAPPSVQEQQTTQRAESQANNMSEEQLASNLEEFTEEMQDSGGFSDQSLTIFLMGRVEGFVNYGGQLQDNPFYDDRGLPISRVQNDRNTMLQLIGTSGKHEAMVAEQYQ